MTTVSDRFPSIIDNYEAKDFSFYFCNLDGISEEQLKLHYGLYEKYIEKVNEVNNLLNEADKSTANHNYSEYRSLQVELVHNFNGVLLHELYFSNLTDIESEPTEELKNIIERDFCTWDNYLDDLKAAGMASRAGWAITAYNFRDGKIHNYVIDQHNINIPIGVKPLLVLDTWEHAFVLDYGTKKAEYIDAFFNNINWDVVSARLESVLKSYEETYE